MIDIEQYTLAERMTALSVYGRVGPRLFELLLAQFGTIENILLAEFEDFAKADGLTEQSITRLVGASSHLDEARALLATLAGRDITVTHRLEESYPMRLLELNDPPTLLFSRGTVPDNTKKLVTLVGPEHATAETITAAAELSRQFAARSVELVASLADPVGQTVHLTSQKAGQRSYTILDGGLDELADAATRAVAISIAEQGAVFSEFLPDARSGPDAYQASNRLLAGLSHAVVFVALDVRSLRLADMMTACNEIGKLAFFHLDPEEPPLSDDASFAQAHRNGIIPMTGVSGLDAIVRSLV